MAKFINNLLISLITTLRPLLGYASCRFTVGCTKYAVEQLAEKRLFSALWAITKRLAACSPFYGLFEQ